MAGAPSAASGEAEAPQERTLAPKLKEREESGRQTTKGTPKTQRLSKGGRGTRGHQSRRKIFTKQAAFFSPNNVVPHPPRTGGMATTSMDAEDANVSSSSPHALRGDAGSSADRSQPPNGVGGSATNLSTPPSYRIFAGDSNGQLKVLQMTCPPVPQGCNQPLPKPIHIRGQCGGLASAADSTDGAVQKMAAGLIDGEGWVVAIARKNASIDVVLPSNSRIDSAACEEQLHATCLATIRNTKMKAGIHRWIGLAVCSTGIYAATSAGDFIFTELQPKNTGADQPSSSTPSNLGLARQLSMSPPQRLQLPEPLQSLVFHPPSNPTHFLCGGEEVPLSIWNIRTALSPRVSTAEQQKESGQYVSPGGELAAESWEAANEGNAKLRKRRRQAEARAKAKELLWGEVWRAKALPNDALSLPQRPNITAIAVLKASDAAHEAPLNKGDNSVPGFQVAAGTRDGLLRLFEPASGARKHTRQIRAIPEGQQGSVRSLTCHILGSNDAEIVAADNNGKLAVIDWQEGKLKYQWKDITGAVSAVVPLPPPKNARSNDRRCEEPTQDPLVLSCSLDRILRLHSMPSKHAGKSSRKRLVLHGQTLASTFTGGSTVTAAVWDGQVPVLPTTAETADEDEPMRKNADEEYDEEGESAEYEDVWNEMQEIGEERNGRRGHQSDVKGSRTEDEDEEEDGDANKVEALREQMSKRNRR